MFTLTIKLCCIVFSLIFFKNLIIQNYFHIKHTLKFMIFLFTIIRQILKKNYYKKYFHTFQQKKNHPPQTPANKTKNLKNNHPPLNYARVLTNTRQSTHNSYICTKASGSRPRHRSPRERNRSHQKPHA